MTYLFLVCSLLSAGPAAAQTETGRQQLVRYLNTIGARQLEERSRAVASIRTREQADKRREEGRAAILRLIGGLPDTRTPLNARVTGAIDGEGFRIENVIFYSQPGFPVTANLYLPRPGSGPFPSVLLSVGHEDAGKISQYHVGVGFARKGFAALAYDPLGQGERLQYYDPELRASRVGGSVAEHGHAGGQALLIGDHIARYFIWDAIRAVDYLASRKEVDPARLGAFGCSGGGTATTYLAALDDRIKVAAPSCYITSWEEILTTVGPQEAEQSIPDFLKAGLNFADWVLLAAPRPYLIGSTIKDYFSIEGARQTYEEARRIYALYGAEDRLKWLVGPGGHGVPPSSREAINAWFLRWFQDGKGDPAYTPARPERWEDLLCTPTGQVGGETVFSLNRRRAQSLMAAPKTVASAEELASFRARLADDIRALARVEARPGAAPPPARLIETAVRDGYRLETLSLASEPGIALPALLAVPDRPGPHPALLVLDVQPKETTAASGGDIDRLARSGTAVLVLQPRGTPESTEQPLHAPILGNYNLLSLRAFVVGKTIPGMRTDDTIRAVDYLCSRPEVDRSRLGAFANGPMGVVLLHAAALDGRLARLYLQNTLMSYRLAVERPIHRNLFEAAIAGVLRRYDLGDLLMASSPRPVSVINPVDQLGVMVRHEEFRAEMRHVFDTDRNLGRAGRVRLLWRDRRDPLPVGAGF